jgi:hypothetical protein
MSFKFVLNWLGLILNYIMNHETGVFLGKRKHNYIAVKKSCLFNFIVTFKNICFIQQQFQQVQPKFCWCYNIIIKINNATLFHKSHVISVYIKLYHDTVQMA